MCIRDRTRTSTGGGVVKMGRRALKARSSTRTALATSSGTARCFGVVKGEPQAFGVIAMMKDLGVDEEVRVGADSAAAEGVEASQ
eukprot:14400681-Alexandrium_andersonii.AAC.1